jgi:glucokinase
MNKLICIPLLLVLCNSCTAPNNQARALAYEGQVVAHSGDTITLQDKSKWTIEAAAMPHVLGMDTLMIVEDHPGDTTSWDIWALDQDDTVGVPAKPIN